MCNDSASRVPGVLNSYINVTDSIRIPGLKPRDHFLARYRWQGTVCHDLEEQIYIADSKNILQGAEGKHYNENKAEKSDSTVADPERFYTVPGPMDRADCVHSVSRVFSDRGGRGGGSKGVRTDCIFIFGRQREDADFLPESCG